jgi:hypothetical protein
MVGETTRNLKARQSLAVGGSRRLNPPWPCSIHPTALLRNEIEKELSMWATLSLIILLGAAQGADVPTVYHEGFESGRPSFGIWAKNAEEPCEVHFAGPTDEKAFAGKKSLKLDLTLRDGSYCYWGTPVKVPAAPGLKLSGYLYVDQIAPGLNVGLGWNVDLPPSRHSGCSTIDTLRAPTGDWRRFEVDLGEIGERTARRVVGSPHVFRYLNRIAVMFTGNFGPGRRAVVYVDELKITGWLPDDYEASMQAEIDRAMAAQAAKVSLWADRARQARASVARLRADLEDLPEPVHRHAVEVADAAVEAADAFLTEAAKLSEQARWMRAGDEAAWIEKLAAIQSAAETLRRPYVIYTRPAITDARLLPREIPVPASVGDTIRLTATPGEYEPATFAVFACRDLDDVTLHATDLRGTAGTIPAEAVDLRVVKVWYQGGIGSIGAGSREPVLVPELLLKDDDLIRVDYENRRNLVRHTGADGGVGYACISDLDPATMPDVAPKDADSLEPFSIPAHSLKQVWVTVHVPDTAPAGAYRGTIHVHAGGKAEGEVDVQLRVLPFRLEPTMHVQSIYYRAKLAENRHPHAVNSEYKTEQQLEAELRNMLAHGLTAPTTYQPFDANLPKVLEIRNRAGFRSGPLFTLGQSTGAGGNPEHLASLKAAVGKWLDLARRHGHDEVYFYGLDEARGDRLASQRPSWQAVREAGGKTFVAGYHGSFEAVGDLQDVLVFAGPPDPDEAAKYHGIGHKILSYANPQCGCEQPERYRRNYGLLLWKKRFDGAMDYAYQHSFEHVWNDFDSTRYRDHVMAYPTVDGVIDTLQWEGYREGVDDTRYLATLLKAAGQASPEKKPVAEAAQKWLDELDVGGDLDAIRSTMIDWILKL